MRVVLGNLPAIGFLLWQPHASWLLQIPLFVLLVIVGCVVTRTLSLEDVSMAKDIFLARKEQSSSMEVDIADQATLILPRVRV